MPWAEQAKLVFDRYRSLPKMPFETVARDDSHFVTYESSNLAHLIGDMESDSAFQTLKKEQGEAKAREHIKAFVKR